MTSRSKTRSFLLTAITLLTFTIAADAVHADQSEVFGTALGAGVGGLVGNQFGRGAGNVAATAGGVVIGGIAGNEIARSFNRPPTYAPAFYDYPSPINTSYIPNYVAPPVPAPPPSPIYADQDSGSYCRQYSEIVRIGNRVNEAYGTACLQPDGSWKVVQ